MRVIGSSSLSEGLSLATSKMHKSGYFSAAYSLLFLSFFLEYRDDVNHSFTSQYPFQPKIVGDTLKSVKFGKRKEVKVEWRGERDRQEEKRNE